MHSPAGQQENISPAGGEFRHLPWKGARCSCLFPPAPPCFAMPSRALLEPRRVDNHRRLSRHRPAHESGPAVGDPRYQREELRRCAQQRRRAPRLHESPGLPRAARRSPRAHQGASVGIRGRIRTGRSTGRAASTSSSSRSSREAKAGSSTSGRTTPSVTPSPKATSRSRGDCATTYSLPAVPFWAG